MNCLLKKVAIFFVFIFISPACSIAHDASLTFLKIEIQNNTISVLFSIPVKNFETLNASLLNSNPDSFIVNYISQKFQITNNGNIVFPQSANAEESGTISSIMVTVKYASAIAFDSLVFNYNLFFEISPTHEAITDISYEKLTAQIIFNKTQNRQLVVVSELLQNDTSIKLPKIQSQVEPVAGKNILHAKQQDSVERKASNNEPVVINKNSIDSNIKSNAKPIPDAFKTKKAYNPFLNFLKLGIEHILTGYDHILFLIALILVYLNFTSTFKVITSFTIAHSITLAISVLGIYFLNPKITEPLIALSIFIIALENMFIFNYQKKKKTLPAFLNPDKRWLITFFFGLIHGFGFSSVLREIGIPKNETAISLLSFNLGVECGQLMILIILLPLILFIKRRPWYVDFFKALSAIVGCCGLIWFFARVF